MIDQTVEDVQGHRLPGRGADAELRDDLEMQPAGKVRKLWVVLRAALATIAVALGFLLVPTAPAQAAIAYGTRDVCFQAPATINGTTYWGIYNQAVWVDHWENGQAVQENTYYPYTNGCLRVNLFAGYYYRFRVYNYVNSTTYTGRSAWTWVNAGSYAHLGTVYLTAVRG